MTDHAIKSGMSCVGPFPARAATARRAAFSLEHVANVVMKSGLSRGAFTDHWALVGSCDSGVIASPVRCPVTRRIHVCLTLRTLRPRASEPLETRCRTPPVRNRPRPPPPTPASRASDIASPTPRQRVRPPPCIRRGVANRQPNHPARPATTQAPSPCRCRPTTSQEEQEPSSCRSARAPPDSSSGRHLRRDGADRPAIPKQRSQRHSRQLRGPRSRRSSCPGHSLTTMSGTLVTAARLPLRPETPEVWRRSTREVSSLTTAKTAESTME